MMCQQRWDVDQTFHSGAPTSLNSESVHIKCILLTRIARMQNDQAETSNSVARRHTAEDITKEAYLHQPDTTPRNERAHNIEVVNRTARTSDMPKSSAISNVAVEGALSSLWAQHSCYWRETYLDANVTDRVRKMPMLCMAYHGT